MSTKKPNDPSQSDSNPTDPSVSQTVKSKEGSKPDSGKRKVEAQKNEAELSPGEWMERKFAALPKLSALERASMKGFQIGIRRLKGRASKQSVESAKSTQGKTSTTEGSKEEGNT